MNSYIMDNNFKNVNAYFITDGDCTETYEEIRAFCQEHHRQYQDANVTLKISALGIGNDVKTECLQEIIKIGSQRGFYDIFSEDDPLIHERVQTIISQSTSHVLTFKQLHLMYGPNNDQMQINLTSQDERYFMFAASKVVKNF